MVIIIENGDAKSLFVTPSSDSGFQVHLDGVVVMFPDRRLVVTLAKMILSRTGEVYGGEEVT